MLKNKMLFLSVLIFAGLSPVFADELTEVTHPKAPAYRLGISSFPERQFVQAQQIRSGVKPEKKYAQLDNAEVDNIADRTYADLSIKNLSREIAQDLELDEPDMIADLSLLWQGAAQQSDTINFALYKLANPDADKPDEKSIKNVLKTIASMSTIVGASMGNPLLAGSSLLGGNIFGIMSQDTKALNYKYTRVTDADMIILIRKIEDLQQNAVNLYYDYVSARKQLNMANDLVDERQRKFELAQKNNAQRELVVITDAYYRTALDRQRTAKAEFYSKRAALEQFVGTDTFLQFESEFIARENGEIPKQQMNSEQEEAANSESDNPEYIETVKTVENYTNSLQEKTQDSASEIPAEELDKNLLKLPALRPLEDIEIDEFGVMTGPSSEVEISEELQQELDDIEKLDKRALKKAKKEEKRNAKLEKKQQKKSDKALKKQVKEDKKAQKFADKQLQKQAKKDEKALKKAQKSKKQFVEEQQEELKPEKLTRNEKRAIKKEEKRLAKEKAAQEKAAKKNKDPLKGMIFLHGQDKSLYRHHHYFSGKPVVPQSLENKNEKTVSTPVTSAKGESPVLEEILPPVVTTPPRQTPADLMGLPPLDAIRVPELTRGGYSIHSEY